MQIDRFNNQITPFLDHIRSYCKEHDKKFSLKPSKYLVADGGRCSGWCDGDELAVASRHHLALEILVHEFSHMTQAVEKDPLWISKHHDYSAVLDAWKNNKPRSLDWSWAGIYHSIKIERDCEERAIEHLRKFKLPINVNNYMQQANLYLHFYHYIFLKRKWYNSTKIYTPDLLNKMPRTHLCSLDSLLDINIELMKEFERVLGVK